MKMKFTKKIATILLSVCLIVPCFSVMALAANGVIFFSDLETSVGDEFTITGTAVVSGDVIGDATIHMTYDPSYMRFEEGDGVNADTDGNLTFKGSGDGSSDRIEFTMKFQALQEGSTRLEQGDATVTDSAGSSVACEEGYADVTIGAGDPSKIKDVASGTSVTIDGQEYTLSGDFSDSMIPAGFTAGEITYNDSTYKGAVQEKIGLQMAYLVDGDGKGDFWMYDSSDSSFSPAEQVVISDTYSIVIFDAGSKVSMPSKYSKGNLEINGKTFADLRLRTRYGINITRVNRAGVDLIPYQGMQLQIGDRVMVVGPENAIEKVAAVLGNSLKKLREPNLVTIFVGIALGVLLGSIPLLNVPQPVKLGLAGGPLIVALLLGRFGPRFHLVTYTTMSANLMLREVGIALFLAAVGLGAGDGFIDAIVGGGYRWIGYGALITVIPLLLVGIFARARLKMNYYTLMGLMAGSMTDPPALAYANGTAGNDMPALSYSTVYPVVMFLRVLTAQIFILFAL